MSPYTCEGCGQDAPLSEPCPRCEKVAADMTRQGNFVAPHLVQGLLGRMWAMREAQAHQ